MASAQKKQTATECLESLQGLKYVMDSKTKHLSQLLVVKGKLEMLKNCQQMQLASYHAKASASATAGERFSKIKRNIEKSKAKEAIAEDEEMEDREESEDEDEQSVLLYKDNSDGEQQMAPLDEDDDDGYDDEEDESDFDEEIERVQVVEGKRQRREQEESDDIYGDEVDGDDFGGALDDSISEDEE